MSNESRNEESMRSENVNLALQLIEEDSPLVASDVFCMLDGTYHRREDGHWWFRAGTGPLWWRYPDTETWLAAHDEWVESTPWVRCESDNPMDVSQHPERMEAMVSTVARINSDMVEFMVPERMGMKLGS